MHAPLYTCMHAEPSLVELNCALKNLEALHPILIHLYYSNLIECIRVLSVAFIACTFEYCVYNHNT